MKTNKSKEFLKLTKYSKVILICGPKSLQSQFRELLYETQSNIDFNLILEDNLLRDCPTIHQDLYLFNSLIELLEDDENIKKVFYLQNPKALHLVYTYCVFHKIPKCFLEFSNNYDIIKLSPDFFALLNSGEKFLKEFYNRLKNEGTK